MDAEEALCILTDQAPMTPENHQASMVIKELLIEHAMLQRELKRLREQGPSPGM